YQTAEEFVRAIQKTIPEDGVFEQQNSPQPPEVSVVDAAHTIQSQPISATKPEKRSTTQSSKPNRLWIWACSGIGLLGLAVVAASLVFIRLIPQNSPSASATATSAVAVIETSAPPVAPTNSPVPIPSPT